MCDVMTSTSSRVQASGGQGFFLHPNDSTIKRARVFFFLVSSTEEQAEVSGARVHRCSCCGSATVAQTDACIQSAMKGLLEK